MLTSLTGENVAKLEKTSGDRIGARSLLASSPDRRRASPTRKFNFGQSSDDETMWRWIAGTTLRPLSTDATLDW